MIELFKLRHSVELSEVGTFPQVEIEWTGPTDFWASTSYTSTPLNGYVKDDIVFPKFKLSNLGKLNDWVGDNGGVGMNYFMISTKLLELLKSFQMDEFQHFPAPVQTKHGIVNYHLIYFPWPRGDDYIDWSKTTFHRKDSTGKMSFVQFQNTKERQLAKDAHEIETDRLVVHAHRITMDVFRFRGFETGVYVSKRLREAILSAGITGIKFEKILCWEKGDL